MKLTLRLAVVVALTGSDVMADDTLTGRTLTEALTLLQDRGLVIVYSSALVRPEMVVRSEPRAKKARAVLDEILEPYGLAVREGPGGQLLVVPANRRETPEPVDALRPVLLHEIVVTPSHTRILDQEPESRQFLEREDVARMPHLADDLYRAVKQLPGATGSDVSAAFNVRGGAPNEVLVVLDGLELYEPFHLKDFFNAFSTLDAAAVDRVDLMTGGFPADYGDRMSGVMDITVRTPTTSNTSVTLGTLNGSVLTSGLTSDARTQWMVSARGWYPDLMLDAARSVLDDTRESLGQLNTDYYDMLAKVQHVLGTRTTVSLSLLAAYDDLGFRSDRQGESERLRSEDTSQHLWLNLQTVWNDALSSRAVLACGHINRERIGGVVDAEDGTLHVDDLRAFDFAQFKQDWTLERADRQLFKWGIDVKTLDARYDYFRQTDRDSNHIDIRLRPKGESYGVYVAERFRLTNSVIAELGLRWDKQFWIEDAQLSPRVNIMYTPGADSVIRAAWGRYYQSQRLNELQVEDGVTRFYRAELAEHWLASFEHRFGRGFGLRVEAYQKNLSRLRPRYENLFSPIDLFPEAQDDRVRVAPETGRARGVELRLKRERDPRMNWWISYTLSEAFDNIGGERVPRSWDQHHAASFGLNLKLPYGWDAGFGGTYHTGWPTTAVTGVRNGDEIELIDGPRNRARLPAYFRLDVRASKSVATRAGDLAFIAEVINLSNRSNVCCTADFKPVVRGNQIDIIRDERYSAPIIPSFSVRWSF